VCNPVKKYTNQNNQGASGNDRRQGNLSKEEVNSLFNLQIFCKGEMSMLDASTTLGSMSTPQQQQSMPPQSQQPQQNVMAFGPNSQIMFGSPPPQPTTVNNLLEGYNP